MGDVWELIFYDSGRLEVVRRRDARIVFAADTVLLTEEVVNRLVHRIVELAAKRG